MPIPSKSLKLGVIFDQHAGVGGGFQQALSSAIACNNMRIDSTTICHIVFSKTQQQELLKHGFSSILIKRTIFHKIIDNIMLLSHHYMWLRLIKFIFGRFSFERSLISQGVDLVYFTSPNPLGRLLDELGYVITVWDECYRDFPSFPEVRSNFVFEHRFFNNLHLLIKANAVIVDSDFGKKAVMRHYGVDSEKIYVVPFAPAPDIIQLKNYGHIKSNIYPFEFDYIFYPAQFWPHKNHVFILDGIYILEEKYNIKVGAVFCGNDYGTKEKVVNYAKNLGIYDRILFRDFVDSAELVSLYKSALAMVMPTYFGPTNLPPLEAFYLGVPVIYSDLDGLRDQVGDAALLVNLTEPETLSLHLKSLIEIPDLRTSMVARGHDRLEDFSQDQLVISLFDIISKYRWMLKCWK